MNTRLQNSRQHAQSLWTSYWSSGRSDRARNALMEHYLPLVKFAAVRLASRNGRHARAGDVDDLMQYGVFGLRDAIRGFDPARGVKFETYCLQRVRGAMLDGLKASQWVPREIRQRLNRFAVVQEELSAQQGAGRHEEAAAGRMGLCTTAIHELQCHAARMNVASLHAGNDLEGQDVPASDIVTDTREEEPADAVQRKDVRDLFFRELTRSERHLMMLYYYENMTMREIGAVLGISGTRVSQLHTEIVNRLRQRLGARVTDGAGQARASLHI